MRGLDHENDFPCVVPFCGNSTFGNPGKHFFRVPEDKDVRARWCMLIGREELQVKTDLICEDHFSLPDDCVNYHVCMMLNDNLRLRPRVLPQIDSMSDYFALLDSQEEKALMMAEAREMAAPGQKHGRQDSLFANTCFEPQLIEGYHGVIRTSPPPYCPEPVFTLLSRQAFLANPTWCEDHSYCHPASDYRDIPRVTREWQAMRIEYGLESNPSSPVPSATTAQSDEERMDETKVMYEEDNYELAENMFKCSECEREFQTLSGLRRHKSTVHSPHYQCDHCFYRVRCKQLLRHHITSLHKNLTRPQRESKFNQRSSLLRPLDLNIPSIYTCHHCSARFRSLTTLGKHIAIHSRKFVCDYCKNSFKSKTKLSSHLANTHCTTRPFLCAHCGCCFRRKVSLKRHISKRHQREELVCRKSPCSFEEQGCQKVHLKMHKMGEELDPSIPPSGSRSLIPVKKFTPDPPSSKMLKCFVKLHRDPYLDGLVLNQNQRPNKLIVLSVSDINSKASIKKRDITSKASIPELETNSGVFIPKPDINSRALIPQLDIDSNASIPKQNVESKASLPEQDVESKASLPEQDVESNPSIPEREISSKVPMAGYETNSKQPTPKPDTNSITRSWLPDIECCKICKKVFLSNKQLMCHMRNRHHNRLCNQCWNEECPPDRVCASCRQQNQWTSFPCRRCKFDSPEGKRSDCNCIRVVPKGEFPHRIRS